jgi:hypothetical protein
MKYKLSIMKYKLSIMKYKLRNDALIALRAIISTGNRLPVLATLLRVACGLRSTSDGVVAPAGAGVRRTTPVHLLFCRQWTSDRRLWLVYGGVYGAKVCADVTHVMPAHYI